MSFLLELTIVAAIIIGSLSLVLFFYSYKYRENVYFALSLFQLFIWNCLHVVGLTSQIKEIIEYSVLLSMSSIVFFPLTLLIFSIRFADKSLKPLSVILLSVVPTIIFILSFTNLNVSNIQGTEYSEIDLGILYYAFLIYFVVYSVSAIYVLLRILMNHKKSIKRFQAGVIAIGTIITVGIAIISNGILPFFFDINSSPVIGTSATLFFAISTSYVLIRYRFLSFHALFSLRTLLLISLISFLISNIAIFYTFLYQNWKTYFFFVIVLVEVLLIFFLSIWLNTIVARFSFRGNIDLSKKRFREIRDKTQHEREMQKIAIDIANSIEDDMVFVSDMLFYQPDKELYRNAFSYNNKKISMYIDEQVFSTADGLYTENESKNIHRLLRKFKSDAVFFFKNDRSISVLVFIQNKGDNKQIEENIDAVFREKKEALNQAFKYYISSETAKKEFIENQYKV